MRRGQAADECLGSDAQRRRRLVLNVERFAWMRLGGNFDACTDQRRGRNSRDYKLRVLCRMLPTADKHTG